MVNTQGTFIVNLHNQIPLIVLNVSLERLVHTIKV